MWLQSKSDIQEVEICKTIVCVGEEEGLSVKDIYVVHPCPFCVLSDLHQHPCICDARTNCSVRGFFAKGGRRRVHSQTPTRDGALTFSVLVLIRRQS